MVEPIVCINLADPPKTGNRLDRRRWRGDFFEFLNRQRGNFKKVLFRIFEAAEEDLKKSFCLNSEQAVGKS